MATPHERPVVHINTSLLYGVFASHKSFLVGNRCLVKREYSNWLAKKATVEKLPQELVDLIAEQLYQLERTTVLSQWKKAVPFAENAAHFAQAPQDTESYRAAMRRIKNEAEGIDWTIVNNDRPHLHGVPKLCETVSYIHISAVQPRPRLAINLPPNSPNLTNSRNSPLLYSAGNRSAAVVSLTRGTDLLAYRAQENTSCARGEAPRVSRLLQCDGVQEAMLNWDSKALRKFVDLLELKMIPVDSTADPMQPGLHLLQVIHDFLC